MAHIKRLNEMLSPVNEYRIYIINRTEVGIQNLPNEKFIREAEYEGLVWSIEGFQDNWNDDADSMPEPEYSYMRIMDANGKPVSEGDDTYRVYITKHDYSGGDKMSKEFIEDAENDGNVWSLAGFQNAWNNNSYSMPTAGFSYIRIFPKDIYSKI